MKIDATVRRETIYIAVWVGILSLLMEAVFLIIGKWDYTVLLGNLLSGAVVQLCLRGSEGDLAVMAGHIPFMTAYAPENAGSKQKTERRGPDM